jgi:hypothetical protein
MTDLLHVVRFTPKALQKKGAIPLLMEFPVNPETAPFLVTSTSALQWVHEAFPNDVIRAAVRRGTSKDTVFTEVFEAIVSLGREAQWGNVHPFSADGLRAAVDHVVGYELTDLEILVHAPKEGAYALPSWITDQGLPVKSVTWLPVDTALVVPKDREYVGFLGLVGTSGVLAVIHNASRGLGVLQGA